MKTTSVLVRGVISVMTAGGVALAIGGAEAAG
jgi:hypothetical protein